MSTCYQLLNDKSNAKYCLKMCCKFNRNEIEMTEIRTRMKAIRKIRQNKKKQNCGSSIKVSNLVLRQCENPYCNKKEIDQKQFKYCTR